MKKYLIIIGMLLVLWFGFEYVYYYDGNYYIPNKNNIEVKVTSKDGALYFKEGDKNNKFEIKGVNLGLGKPGKFATDYSITKEEYLRWFKQIQDMGANVIRNYTIAHPEFYEAFYEYNLNNPKPLYLIHGVWVDDYLINSRLSALDKEFYEPFLKECKNMVDVTHGRFKQIKEGNIVPDKYDKDISKWVYGYILGIEWEGDLVTYTNKSIEQRNQYLGEYLKTNNASNFEIFLAMVGDEVIKYETEKYSTQQAIAFANWPNTCPIEFSEEIKLANKKFGKIDVENIYKTEKYKSTMYASYHIYPYYPEYVSYEDNYENTYYEYIRRLNQHHNIPVIISEFGIPASRGMASYEKNRKLARDQGRINEKQQGEAMVSLYKDIINSGSAGGIVFIWQDEWFKRTWNTIPTVDLEKIIYWNDVQTNEQHFGVLSFEPGEDKKICYIDGDEGEWRKKDTFISNDNIDLSIKYDIESIYLKINKKGLNIDKDKIFIPIDTTPKTGTKKAEKFNITFSEKADFILEINGKENTRLWVQERYDNIRALYGNQLKRRYNQFENVPKKDSPKFNKINMLLQELDYYKCERIMDPITKDIKYSEEGKRVDFKDYDFIDLANNYTLSQVYETGVLRYGNGNPKSENFDSIADFCVGKDTIELRIPWGLINFGDVLDMKIHDDYYEKYGVEFIPINHINIGIGNGSKEIKMYPYELEKFDKNIKYHERLKKSYYILKDYWNNENKAN